MTEIEINKMLRLMSYETSKIPANDAVPCRTCSRVELFLDVLSYVLFNGVLLHGILSNFDGLMLHFLAHIRSLDLGVKLVCFLCHVEGSLVER